MPEKVGNEKFGPNYGPKGMCGGIVDKEARGQEIGAVALPVRGLK